MQEYADISFEGIVISCPEESISVSNCNSNMAMCSKKASVICTG